MALLNWLLFSWFCFCFCLSTLIFQPGHCQSSSNLELSLVIITIIGVILNMDHCKDTTRKEICLVDVFVWLMFLLCDCCLLLVMWLFVFVMWLLGQVARQQNLRRVQLSGEKISEDQILLSWALCGIEYNNTITDGGVAPQCSSARPTRNTENTDSQRTLRNKKI